jgi:hypothetical protein
MGERYENTTSGRRYLLIREFSGLCTLEGIDRRVIDVRREVLDRSEVWRRVA